MTQSWEDKDLRHLENIAIRSHDLWSHLPRPTCAVILLPIIPSFLPSTTLVAQVVTGRANTEGSLRARQMRRVVQGQMLGQLKKDWEIKLLKARRRLRQHLCYEFISLISEAKNKGKERVPLRGFNWEVKTNHDSQPPWSHDHGNFQKKRYMTKVLQRASALTSGALPAEGESVGGVVILRAFPVMGK